MLEDEYNPRRSLPGKLRKRPAPEPAFAFTIRDAVREDVPHFVEIYNHYVTNSTITFDEAPVSYAGFRDKFLHVRKLGLPWLVAETPSGQLIGFAYVYPWKEKAGYRRTVENSIYLRPASTGKGLGSALLERLLHASKEAGVREVIAVIADKQAEGSIALHMRFGFTKVSAMAKVGFKFGRWLGIVVLQKRLR